MRLLFILFLFSCTKEPIPIQECQSITWMAQSYDKNWKVIEVYKPTTTHWCNVCSDELARFKRYGIDTLDCGGERKTFYWRITKDTCKIKNY
jgi:hypothetical protein